MPAALVRKAVKLAAIPAGSAREAAGTDIVMLLYHRIGVGRREIDLERSAFERQLQVLAAGNRGRTLDDALVTGGVVVTFDDGTADFHEHALPLLERYRVPALLYLATGLVAGPGGWGSRPVGPNGEGSLAWSQVEEAVAGGFVSIGSHTHSHADLSRVDEGMAEEEMRRSKELIEDRVGHACNHFAYPWAVASAAADRAARRHFDSAALAWRTNRRGRLDPFTLGRLPVLRNDGPMFFQAKVSGRLDAEAIAYRLLRRGPWRRR